MGGAPSGPSRSVADDLSFVFEAGAILSTSQNPATCLGALVAHAVPYFADWCFVHLADDAGRLHLLATHAKATVGAALAELARCYPPAAGERPGVSEVLRTGQPLIYPAIDDSLLATAAVDAQHLLLLRALGLTSYLAVPLVPRRGPGGVLSFALATDARRFTPADIALATDLARRAALALDSIAATPPGDSDPPALSSLSSAFTASSAELDAVIEAIPDALFICDADLRLTRVNARAAWLMGLPSAQALQSLDDYVLTNNPRYPDGSPIPVADSPLVRGRRGEVGTDFQAIVRNPATGLDIQVRCSYAPIRARSGAIIGAVSILIDMTEIYRLEQQRDQFLSMASHELKTPITTIKGSVQLAGRRLARAGQEDVAALLRDTLSHIDRLTALVDDLLDANRVRTATLALQLGRFDLAGLVRHVSAALQMTTDRHTLTVQTPPLLEVFGDESRLEQVLTNLIGNAIKYSPAGGAVEITLSRAGAEALVCVRDYGIGIPVEDRKHLFESFTRASNAPAHHIEGFGLGLYISSEIIQAHQGRIWLAEAGPADPAEPRGSRFCFTVPALPA